MSEKLNRPEIDDFWDDCIQIEFQKKAKKSKQKSNSSENTNYNNYIFINNNNKNLNQRNKNKFLNNHKLLKKVLNTEESIPKLIKKNEEKQIEILISLYNLREKKIKAELEKCPFKPEKKYKRNKSYEETYKKNFGKKNIYEREKYYKNKYEKKIKEYKKEEKEGKLEEKRLYSFKPKIEKKDINKVLYENNMWEKLSNNFSNKIFLWRYMKARKDELDKKKKLMWSMDKNCNFDDDENINNKGIINNNKNIHRSISQKDSLLYKKTLHFSLLDFRTNHDDDNNNNNNQNDKNNNNTNILIK